MNRLVVASSVRVLVVGTVLKKKNLHNIFRTEKIVMSTTRSLQIKLSSYMFFRNASDGTHTFR